MTDEKRSSRTPVSENQKSSLSVISIILRYIIPYIFIAARVGGSLGASLFGVQNVMRYLSFGKSKPEISVPIEVVTSVANVTGNFVSRPRKILKLFEDLDKRRLEMSSSELTLKWAMGWDEELTTTNNYLMMIVKAALLGSGVFTGIGAYNGGETLMIALVLLINENCNTKYTLDEGPLYGFTVFLSLVLTAGMVASYLAFEYAASKKNMKTMLGTLHDFQLRNGITELTKDNFYSQLGWTLRQNKSYVHMPDLNKLYYIERSNSHSAVCHTFKHIPIDSQTCENLKTFYTSKIAAGIDSEDPYAYTLTNSQLKELRKISGESNGLDVKATLKAALYSTPFILSQPVLFFYNTGRGLERLPGASHYLTPGVKKAAQGFSAATGVLSVAVARLPSLERALQAKESKTALQLAAEKEILDNRTPREVAAVRTLKGFGLIDAAATGLQFAVSIPFVAAEIFPEYVPEYVWYTFGLFLLVAPSSGIVQFMFNTVSVIDDAIADRVRPRLAKAEEARQLLVDEKIGAQAGSKPLGRGAADSDEDLEDDNSERRRLRSPGPGFGSFN